MANFAGTQAVDFGGGSKTLVKINQDTYSSEYYLRESTAEYRMKIRHTKSTSGGQALDRHNVEITKVTFAVPNTSPEYIQKAYFVFEAPPGYIAVGPMAGLCAWATASTNEALTNLVGWQS